MTEKEKKKKRWGGLGKEFLSIIKNYAVYSQKIKNKNYVVKFLGSFI